LHRTAITIGKNKARSWKLVAEFFSGSFLNAANTATREGRILQTVPGKTAAGVDKPAKEGRLVPFEPV
jgi:hypothetical protein